LSSWTVFHVLAAVCVACGWWGRNRILIILCNKNQLDEIFILSLFRQSTSTCFGHICIPSSGGILYIYSNWYVLCFAVDYLLAQHLQIVVYICSIPGDNELQICPKHLEVDWRNKLRINRTSSWFLLHGKIELKLWKNLMDFRPCIMV
jgi:hypothetical protein